jgi:hypothetical protein
MSDITTIRTLIADPIRYDRSTATGDGATREFMVPNSPVVANSQTVVIDTVVKTEGGDYVFDDDLGLTTFTAAPGANTAIVITYRFSILSETQIQALLDLEGGVVYLGAAACLESIAASEVLIQKRIKQLDFETDGPAEAKELRALAKTYRERADAAAGDGAGFDTAEFAETFWQQREKLYKERLREGL